MFINKTIKSIIMIRKFTYLFFTLLTTGLVAQTSVTDSPLFAAGANASWPHIIVAAKAADASSQSAQTLEINITTLPEGGANYRVYKTTSNGGDYVGDAKPLALGLNTLTVTAVTFTRAVKYQFSSGVIEFDAISLNSSNNSQTIASNVGGLFTAGSNASWPFVYSAAQKNDGDAGNDGAAQTLEINITSLPPTGANYRIGKTTANGEWFFATAQPLALGVNTITVASVTFDRSVRFQFGDGATVFDALSLNDESVLSVANINASHFTLYPNPASGIITVSGVENIKSIKVFSILGSLEKEVLNANQVDVSGLSKGFHMITVDNGTVFTKKFIVK